MARTKSHQISDAVDGTGQLKTKVLLIILGTYFENPLYFYFGI